MKTGNQLSGCFVKALIDERARLTARHRRIVVNQQVLAFQRDVTDVPGPLLKIATNRKAINNTKLRIMVSLFNEISIFLAIAPEKHLEPATPVPNKDSSVWLVLP